MDIDEKIAFTVGIMFGAILAIATYFITVDHFRDQAIDRGYMELCLGTETPYWKGECPI